jgi:hypothetical protein
MPDFPREDMPLTEANISFLISASLDLSTAHQRLRDATRSRLIKWGARDMAQRLNFKLLCHDCGVIYLHIPNGVTNSTVIHCSSCDMPLGTWLEIEASFIAQGGQDGEFEMREGQIIRED